MKWLPRRRLILALGVMTTISFETKVSAEEHVRAVTIGGSARLAACPERAFVADKRRVALLSQPQPMAPRKNYLGSGAQLFVCERLGEWIGVVVAAIEPEKCGVSVAIERREPYRGGCASGWLLRDEVVIKTN